MTTDALKHAFSIVAVSLALLFGLSACPEIDPTLSCDVHSQCFDGYVCAPVGPNNQGHCRKSCVSASECIEFEQCTTPLGAATGYCN